MVRLFGVGVAVALAVLLGGGLSQAQAGVFGYTDSSASVAGIDNVIVGTFFTAPEDGTVESLTVYIQANTFADPSIKCAIYKWVNLTTPCTLLVNSASAEITDTTINMWRSIPPAGAKAELDSGQAYLLVVWGYNAASAAYVRFDGSAASEFYKISQSQTYGSWPNTLESFGSTTTDKVSIYCTYSVPTLGPTATPRRRRIIQGVAQ